MSTTEIDKKIEQVIDERDVSDKAGRSEYMVAVLGENSAVLAIRKCLVEVQAYSLNKIAIARAAMTGEVAIDLDRSVALPDGPRPGGTGLLQYLPEGYDVTYGQLIDLMLRESDNWAAKLVVNKIFGNDTSSGANEVNEVIEGLGEILATRLEDKPELSPHSFYMGHTNALEIARLFKEVTQDEWFRDQLCRSHARYGLRRHIDAQPSALKSRSLPAVLKLARGRLPKALYDQILQSPQEAGSFPSKEGSYDWYGQPADSTDQRARHDVAQIGGKTVAILSIHERPGPNDSSHPAREIQGTIGQLIYAEEFADKVVD